MVKIDSLKPGTLHILTGGMKAEKTVQLISPFIKLGYAGIPYQVFKSDLDYREELHEKFNVPRNYLLSRTGMNIEAFEFDHKTPYESIMGQLNIDAKVIGIGESTLTSDPDGLVKAVLELMGQKKTLIVDGLDRNFHGEKFEPIATLMAYARTVEKFYGICDIPTCSEIGDWPQLTIDKTNNDGSAVIVGDSIYSIRCYDHFTPTPKNTK